jgi:hypothetical protein
MDTESVASSSTAIKGLDEQLIIVFHVDEGENEPAGFCAIY